MTIPVRPAIEALLEARSVAVVGASRRPGSVGNQMMRQLIGGGFRGRVVAVNPRYEQVEGRPCVSSLHALPDAVDLAILGVPNRVLEQQLRAAADSGVRAAVIFASGYEASYGGTPLEERLRALARDSGMAVCGGNCMGFVNFEHNLRALAFEERADLRPGNIAWITHSGSAFTALLHNDRCLRFNLAVSAGQEFTTTVADYLAYAAAKPSTRVIALFLETVRDPDGFRAALEEATRRDIPVVALKVGREAAARGLVAAHSGALAGEDAVFDAVFDAHGVWRVRSLNEMADALELVTAGRRARPGGLAAIGDSGGERAHLIDVGAEVGVRFAAISEATVRRLEEILEPGLPAVNPLDAWGTGNAFESIFLECMRALLDDPDTGALAFVVDLSGEDLERGYADVAEQVFRETSLPVAVLSNLACAVDPGAAARLRAAGVPVLEDTHHGLAAFRQLFAWREWRSLPPVALAPPLQAPRRPHWVRRLREGRHLGQAEALALLGDYGVPVAATAAAASLDEALAAAGSLGYPVALKIAGAAHKTDVGGVRLGLADETELRRAYARLAGRFGAGLLVQAMAGPGVEMALGLVRDSQFGPVVLASAGGVLVEYLGDRSLALPPLDRHRAVRLVDSLRVRPLLDGVRGRPATDVGALVDALVRLSWLAADLGEHIAEMDVNPFVVGPRGGVAVDALVIPRPD